RGSAPPSARNECPEHLAGSRVVCKLCGQELIAPAPPAVELMHRVFYTPACRSGPSATAVPRRPRPRPEAQGDLRPPSRVRHRERRRQGGLRSEGGTADLWVDGDLVTGKHPEAVAQFVPVFVQEFQTELTRRRPGRPAPEPAAMKKGQP